MKIRALVQSDQWLDRAGVRIRYRRIAPHMEALGASLNVDVIDNLKNRWLIDDDVVILSKCTDVRALLAADYLRERGIIVGVDMFDDYFSPNVSPCHSHREFLREIAPKVDFFLCSTGRMREVMQEFAPGSPSHVLNDPFDRLDKAWLEQRLVEKAKAALESRRIEALWFGIGDNPIFPVGLTDLAAHASSLEPFVRSGFDVRLKVMTNLRALHSENLARLRGMGLQLQLEEWSQEGEAAAMDESLLSFLPVNHQNFSIAKSLNRGISALTGGTQILSAGFDLYSAISDFRYRNADDFIADLSAEKLRLRPDTLDALENCMDGLADPQNEAGRLFGFLQDLWCRAGSGTRLVSGTHSSSQAVLHGRRTPFAAVAYGRERGIMSVGTPFSNAGRRFDVLFDFNEGGSQVEIRVAQSGACAIASDMQQFLKESPTNDLFYPYVMDLPATAEGAILKALRPYMIDTRAGQMVHYGRTMGAIETMCRMLLPDTTIFRSELESPLLGMARFGAGAPSVETRQ